MAEDIVGNCNHILPTHEVLLTPGLDPVHEIYSCLLPKGHADEHLIQLNNGQYVIWDYDREPHECEYPEECECFVYARVSAEEAQKILQSQPHQK